MANILNVTPPITGQENLGRVRPQNPNEGVNAIHQVIDPNKVTKTQDQNVYQDRQAQQYQPNLDSNFDKFMQAIRNMPGMSQLYSELFYSKMGNIVNAGIGENFAQEIAKFMEMIKMDPSQLLEMLKGQQGQNLKFSGPFFDILRQMINSNVSNDLKVAVLDFLRKYDSLTSSKHILNNIVANIKNIAVNIPQSVGSQLSSMLGKLSLEGTEMGNNPQNLAILKNEVIPFLSQYISATKDLGAVRNLIAVLTLNIARYEAGTKESFMAALRTLTSYGEIGRLMGDVKVDDLAARLATTGQNQGNELVDKLISIIAKGMNGEAGFQNKAVFQNMVSSILINESVYMPLVHYMLPANVNGGMFFSEIWVDPNAEGEKHGGEEGRAVKLLIKFDIKDVGFFDTIILAQNGKVDMELYYPEKFVSKELEIKDALTEIMQRNNLSFRSLFLAKCETPKTVSEVFPKLYDRRNAINVVI